MAALRRAFRGAERGSASLELLLMTPVLAGLVLFVVWAGDSGRVGLTATLAAEEAAVAAGEMCNGGTERRQVDEACASSVAEQVAAARTEPGSSCTAATRVVGAAAQDAKGKAVVVEVVCDPGGLGHWGAAGGVDGPLRLATGIHIPTVDFRAEPVPTYTGDRPVDPMLCRWSGEPYPERPAERGPGSADASKLAAFYNKSQPIPRTAPSLPPGLNYDLVCNAVTLQRSHASKLSHDVVLAVWTEDARDPLLRKMKAGDTCVGRDKTGVEYLRIPKEHPQFLLVKAGASSAANDERVRYPVGVCRGVAGLFGGPNTPSRGAFDVHVEIVSGGTGKVRLLCDGLFCRPQPGDIKHAITYSEPRNANQRHGLCLLLINYFYKWVDPPGDECDVVIAHWRKHY